MSRLPAARRETLSPQEQAIWDRIVAVRTGMAGPYGALIHVPALADRVAGLEDYFRFKAALPAVDRELVILAAAREWGAHYPWMRHETRAREAGTRSEALEIVRAKDSLDGLTPRERVLVEIVRSLLRDHKLSDDLFARAMSELDREQLVETIALAGHYSLIGLIVNAFDVAAPEGSRTF